MSTLTVTQAFRAFNRAMAPLHEEHRRALEAGAAVDCGEWSGEAIDTEYDRRFEEAEYRVMSRLGYDAHDFFHEEQRQWEIQMSVGVAP